MLVPATWVVTNSESGTIAAAYCDRPLPYSAVVYSNGMLVSMLIKLLLRSFSGMYALWRQKQYLTSAEVHQGQTLARKFGECWGTLEWKPTPWAHWAASHSGKVLTLYKTMYLFSTIPVEYWNRTFKVRLKNCMRGWCLKKPRATKRGMTHVVNTDTLVVGVHLQRAKAGKGAALLERKRRRTT